MKNILLMTLVLTVVGCATAQPFFYNGKYYMIGDSTCLSAEPYGVDKVMCYDKNKAATGWRPAMTNQ